MDDARMTYQDVARSGKCLGFIIAQAVSDLGPPRQMLYGYEAYRRDRARAWFESNMRGVGSFLWVCRHIGWSPSWIRRRIREGKYNPNAVSAGNLKRLESSLFCQSPERFQEGLQVARSA
jgi:hypothetical protein